ncbi:MAG: MFS transporter [Anaerolineae bacterium]|nr:MFS transporter [Anaerolineae bacterium]
MTSRQKIIAAVYLSGFLQGIALIMFPAAGPLLTNPDYHNLTAGQFGLLFTPQIIAAIIASALAARCVRWFGGMKQVLLAGLLADVLAMSLLALSNWFIGVGSLAFILLLLATGAVGAGFGFAVSALNAFAFDLFRDKADAAVTGLHVLTGLGQVGAALILGVFVGLGFWWGAPVVVGVALVLMMVFQLGLDLKLSAESRPMIGSMGGGRLPGRIWLYAVVVFLYGICEGTFGNWSPIYLEQDAGLTMGQAALALSVFWGAVTVGRALFALIALRFNSQPFYLVAPWVVGAAFVALPLVSGFGPHIVILAAAGLALSFFFPLSVSLASAEVPVLAATVSGTMVAAIMLGAGFSANVVGLLSEPVGLATIFQFSSLYAFAMAGIVFYLALTKRPLMLSDEEPEQLTV